MAHYTQRRSPGSTRAFELLLGGWDRAAWDTEVALPGEGELTRVVEKLGLPVHAASFRATGGAQGVAQGLRFAGEVEECLRLLDALAPDLVYASGAIPAIAVAARLRRTPSICHLHQPLITAHQARSGRASRVAGLHNYDHLIATSAWTRQLLQSLFRPDPARLVAIPCGVDLAEFEPGRIDRAAARARLGLPSEGPVVLVAGFLSATKRPELAIEVLPHLPGVTLAFAGSDQGYLVRLQSLVVERRVAERVHFLGFVDMAQALAASDLLLHCNPDEPFGLVLVEAMAMRLPVVAPRAAGPSEIVSEGETGLLFDDGTAPGRIAELVGSLLHDPARAARMGEHGQRRARDRFSKGEFVSAVDRACRRLLA